MSDLLTNVPTEHSYTVGSYDPVFGPGLLKHAYVTCPLCKHEYNLSRIGKLFRVNDTEIKCRAHGRVMHNPEPNGNGGIWKCTGGTETFLARCAITDKTMKEYGHLIPYA